MGHGPLGPIGPIGPFGPFGPMGPGPGPGPLAMGGRPQQKRVLEKNDMSHLKNVRNKLFLCEEIYGIIGSHRIA